MSHVSIDPDVIRAIARRMRFVGCVLVMCVVLAISAAAWVACLWS